MTLQEVKDEMKDSEGKPEVKGRIRQLQREMAQRRMMEAVPEADVVITNPEHFSIALKYDVEGGGAPILVAKGVDFLAIKIREIANANDVMILAAPPLARLGAAAPRRRILRDLGWRRGDTSSPCHRSRVRP